MPTPDESLETHAAAVFDVMTELLRIYQFRDRDRVNAHGITVTQTYALEVVLRLGEATAKEIAQELSLEKSTISRLVDSMVEANLVEKADNPSDGRSALLRATPSGRRAYNDVRRAVVRENAAALDRLSGEERVLFIETLERFTEAARRRIRSGS
jgi:DNA-binding MarR family transcriptional regulator